FLFQGWNLQYPKTGFAIIYLDKILLVVTTKDELPKEFDFPLILPLGFQFVEIGRTQVLDPFGQFFLIKEYLVYTDQKLVGPIGIKLTAKAIIGEIGQVIVEHGF